MILVSLTVDTFGTGVASEDALLKLIKQAFNFSPRAIHNELQLESVKYYELAKYGHIGRADLGLPWEQLPKLAHVLQLGLKLIDAA